jgi:hypothetical protein
MAERSTEELIIPIPAIFSKMTPRVDKSWKLEFETRELFGEDIKTWAEKLGGEGFLVYGVNDTKALYEAVPEKPAHSGMDGKTPSQRLRGALYVLWEQRGKPSDSFELYYASKMEKLIETVKAELE